LRATIVSALLLIVISLLAVSAHAQPIAGQNVDVTTGNDTAERQQVEPTIAVDPHNPSIVVAGAQDYRLLSVGAHRWHGFYRSIDGGQTWSVGLVPGFPGDNSPQGLSSPLRAFQCTSDPVLAFDRNGNLYYVGISCLPAFILFVVKYTNDGATYSSATVFNPSIYNYADKPWIVVDTSGGPNAGSVYISYDAIGFAPFGATVVHSADGGLTWSGPQLALNNGFLSGATVDSQGRLFVTALLAPGRTHSTIFNLIVAVSADGGNSFTGHETIATVALLPSPLPGNFFRTFTIPQITSDSNGVYVVWDDYSLNNSNVMFAKSTDGGAAWTRPTMVNDVLTGQHFFSSIAASGGVISIIWYDSRNGQLSSGYITNLDVYYAESTNAGATFSANIRVTSTSFNPNNVERADGGDTEIFMGDYIQVAASPGTAHAVWADNRNACDNIVQPFGCTDQDAFTATITT